MREAIALGLDRGDAVIRRQLRLKMEFLAQDAASLGEPTDEELRALLAREADRFLVPARISFRQSSSTVATPGRGGDAGARPAGCSRRCRARTPRTSPTEAGDRFLLGYDFRQMPAPEIGRQLRRRRRGRAGDGAGRPLDGPGALGLRAAPAAGGSPHRCASAAVRGGQAGAARRMAGAAPPRGARCVRRRPGRPLYGDDRGRDRRHRGGGAVQDARPSAAAGGPARRARSSRPRGSPRTRCARPISNFARPAPRPGACCGRCRRSASRSGCASMRGCRRDAPRSGRAARSSSPTPMSNAGASAAQRASPAASSASTACPRSGPRCCCASSGPDGTGRHHRPRHPGGADLHRTRRAARLAEVLETYLALGVHHILLGADHLLFVLALLLIVRGWRRLAADHHGLHGRPHPDAGRRHAGRGQLARTAGRGGHRAQHRLRRCRGAARAARRAEPDGMRAPWAVALLFGLLHGLGFAGALREIGLPENAVLPALLFFNLGVELGQLAVCQPGRSAPVGRCVGWSRPAGFGPSGAAAAADAPGGLLRHRRHGGLLADRACPGVLVLNAGDVTRRTRIVWAILRSAPSDSAKAMGDEPGAALKTALAEEMSAE